MSLSEQRLVTEVMLLCVSPFNKLVTALVLRITAYKEKTFDNDGQYGQISNSDLKLCVTGFCFRC